MFAYIRESKRLLLYHISVSSLRLKIFFRHNPMLQRHFSLGNNDGLSKLNETTGKLTEITTDLGIYVSLLSS